MPVRFSFDRIQLLWSCQFGPVELLEVSPPLQVERRPEDLDEESGVLHGEVVRVPGRLRRPPLADQRLMLEVSRA